jgi:hypothetical protein
MKTKIFAALILVLFLAQLYLLYTTTWWGPETRFPMNVLLIPMNAAVPGVLAILCLPGSKSGTQRNILYSIIVASAVQVITIKIMLWLREPSLVVLVLLSADFIAFQYLQYFTQSNSTRETPSKSTTAKGTASIPGILFRLTLVGAGSLLLTRLMVGPMAFSEFGIITIIVLMLPIAIIAILKQRRLIRPSGTQNP